MNTEQRNILLKERKELHNMYIFNTIGSILLIFIIIWEILSVHNILRILMAGILIIFTRPEKQKEKIREIDYKLAGR